MRSANNMDGYELWNKKYMIGRLENFILDERSWLIRYLQAKTGDWLLPAVISGGYGIGGIAFLGQPSRDIARVSDADRVLIQSPSLRAKFQQEWFEALTIVTTAFFLSGCRWKVKTVYFCPRLAV